MVCLVVLAILFYLRSVVGQSDSFFLLNQTKAIDCHSKLLAHWDSGMRLLNIGTVDFRDIAMINKVYKWQYGEGKFKLLCNDQKEYIKYIHSTRTSTTDPIEEMLEIVQDNHNCNSTKSMKKILAELPSLHRFVFPMHPIIHFLHGIFHRFKDWRYPIKPTPRLTKTVIYQLFTLPLSFDRLSGNYMSYHYPMTGATVNIGRDKVVYIGYFDQAEKTIKSWEELQQNLQIELPPLERNEAQELVDAFSTILFAPNKQTNQIYNLSSNKYLNQRYNEFVRVIKQSFIDLSKTEPNFIVALCHYYFKDFEVFNYDFPDVCSNINTSNYKKNAEFFPTGTLIKCIKDRTVYTVMNNSIFAVPSMKWLQSHNLKLSDVVSFDDRTILDNFTPVKDIFD